MNSPKPNLLFETYFENIYGPRWQALKEKLGVPEKQVLRRNLFAENSPILSPILADAVAELADCYWKPDLFRLEKNTEGLYGYYVMDPASVITALALEARPDETVLDMCAAPGGKSLVLAEAMRSGNLILNEMSESRRERLNRVLHEYIPRDHRLFIAIKGLDGNQYGLRQPGVYDRVLADVPCSGERHLFENSSELSLWTVKRTKNLAVRQFSLLSSAWLSVKTGGRIVYSTCSISPEENDAVAAKLVKKRKPRVLRPEFLKKFDFLEVTEFGYQILPDRCGFGPMYFSVLEKT